MAKLTLTETISEKLGTLEQKEGMLTFVKDTHSLYKDTADERILIADGVSKEDLNKKLDKTEPAASVQNALTVGEKSYDGSKAVELTAEDVGAATIDHVHKAEDITEGILDIEHGGTGNEFGFAHGNIVKGITDKIDVLDTLDAWSSSLDVGVGFYRIHLQADSIDALPSELTIYHAPLIDAIYAVHQVGTGYKHVIAYDVRTTDRYAIQKNETDWGNWEKINVKLYDSTGQNDNGAMTQKAVTDAVDGATSHHWDITVDAADWTDATDSFAGITAHYKANKSCEGMTESTDISGIQFIEGGLNAASMWQYLRPGTDVVDLYGNEKPTESFTFRLTEAK